MLLFKNKIFLIIISSIIVIFAVPILILLNAGKKQMVPGGELVPVNPVSNESTGYPNNLLEGRIIAINLEDPTTLVIMANISKIISGAEEMEKTVKIGDKTGLFLYDLNTKEETPLGLDELKIDDQIVAATEYPTNE